MTDTERILSAIEEVKRCVSGRKNKPKDGMRFSKKLLVCVILMVHVVIAASLYLMWRFQDLSALSILIGATVGEGIAAIIWYMKKTGDENVAYIQGTCCSGQDPTE